jgi:serine/threonine protein kinase
VGLKRSLPDPEPDAEPGGAVPVEPENRGGDTATRGREKHASWELGEGDVLIEGRTVVRTLGGGTDYEVFLVWDDHFFTLMVAKVLRPDRADDPSSLRSLAREAEALDRVAHPVLVRKYDAVLDGPRPHVLIEHFEGATLRRLIKRHGPLPMDQLLPLALNVAAAIHYLAAEEMVHLDVKPDNIVMGIPPRLIDLSIARTFEQARKVKGSIGTDAYMPPEQCRPTDFPGAIGPHSDVWGLGATLYHAAAGRVPFPRPKGARRSEDDSERFPQLANDPEPLPRDVPDGLAALIMSTLRKAPEERPTAADLALGLEPLIAALPSRLVLARRGAHFR